MARACTSAQTGYLASEIWLFPARATKLTARVYIPSSGCEISIARMRLEGRSSRLHEVNLRLDVVRTALWGGMATYNPFTSLPF
jgi:hypothetical protein